MQYCQLGAGFGGVYPSYLFDCPKSHAKYRERPRYYWQIKQGMMYQLTPAHRKIMQDADLVIWLGKAHEAPLESCYI